MSAAREIEVDLRGLAFIDSTGLKAILTAQELCGEHRAAFFLIPSEDPAQRRLFEIIGLFDVFAWREGH